MNSFVVDLIIPFVSTFKSLVISWSIKQFGTNCRFLQMGRIVSFSKWDELTLGTNWRLGRIVAFWNLGRIVAWDELSLFGIWDELSLGTNCRLGRIVAQLHFKTIVLSNPGRLYKNHLFSDIFYIFRKLRESPLGLFQASIEIWVDALLLNAYFFICLHCTAFLIDCISIA